MDADRLRWLIHHGKHLTLDGAAEIARAAPAILAEIDRLTRACEGARSALSGESAAAKIDRLERENKTLRKFLAGVRHTVDLALMEIDESADNLFPPPSEG